MRRAVLALVLLAALAAAGPAQASKTVDVPATFRPLLSKVHAGTRVPVLLPATMRLDFDRGQRLYASAAARRSGYTLELAAVRLCGGATACFGATFTARRGARLGTHANVTLARGVKGAFTPL